MTFGGSRTAVFVLIGILLNGLVADLGFAQSDDKNKKTAKKKLPEIESVTFVTKDNVEIHADYFGGMHAKETLPVLLLHDFDSSRTAMLPLAKHLQKKYGHAVLVPDLRGHGESMRVQGVEKDIERSKFKKMELASIFEDLEQCKRFLMAKNNVGELNIDLLSVVAVGSTCIQAAHWVNQDWTWEPVGGLKQGKDIKSFAMISPVKRFKGINIAGELKNPLLTGKGGDGLPVFMTWGSTSETASKDGNSIHQLLGKSRPKVNEKFGSDSWWEQETLIKVERKSSSAGTKFLKDQQGGVSNDVGMFIENKVLAIKDDHRWQNRSSKPTEEEDDEDEGDSDEAGSGGGG